MTEFAHLDLLNGRDIAKKRYLLPDETEEQWYRRIAHAIGSAEHEHEHRDTLEEELYSLLATGKVCFNSPTMMSAGAPKGGTLSACFVIPIGDSMVEINEAHNAAAMVLKFGGGCGFDFSNLRPRGCIVHSTHGAACGPVSVLRHLDDVSRLITQGGKREAANMGILSVWHPDILEWIQAKALYDIPRFNISVMVNNVFMKAVKEDVTIIPTIVGPMEGSYFNVPVSGEYDAHGLPVVRRESELSAKVIWDAICESAWERGDPGLLFYDRINRDNPTPWLGTLKATNPCGEVPLLPWESCNLASINLAAFVKDGDFDDGEFKSVVRTMIRALDNVITINPYPSQEIQDASLNTRKVGLGVAGWHDALILMEIPYGSSEAIETAFDIAHWLREEADRTSCTLAQEKGPYHGVKRSPDSPTDCDAPTEITRRNATGTCIAPTGSIALLMGCSSGIEPWFSFIHKRRLGDGTEYVQIAPTLVSIFDRFDIPSAARDSILKSLQEGKSWGAAAVGVLSLEFISKWAEVFRAAHEIDPQSHLMMQVAWQEHIELAVSKTINLPNTASVEDVRSIYVSAYTAGVKGITVYRDGCLANQPLQAIGAEEFSAPSRLRRRRLPDTRDSVTHKFSVGGVEGYVTVGLFDDGLPGEVFITCSKQGSTLQGVLDGLAITTSLALQYGVPLEVIAAKWRRMRFEPADLRASSVLDAIAAWLRARFLDVEEEEGEITGVVCPECGESLVMQENCLVCLSCGYTKC